MSYVFLLEPDTVPVPLAGPVWAPPPCPPRNHRAAIPAPEPPRKASVGRIRANRLRRRLAIKIIETLLYKQGMTVMSDDKKDTENNPNTSNTETNKDDYEVGYGKPPKATRWKKGQSGNRRGRGKGNRGLKTDLKAALKESMTIRMNGKNIKGSRQQIMLHTLSARAASGDVRATKLLTDLIISTIGIEDEGHERKRLSETDAAALEALLADGGLEVPQEEVKAPDGDESDASDAEDDQ